MNKFTKPILIVIAVSCFNCYADDDWDAFVELSERISPEELRQILAEVSTQRGDQYSTGTEEYGDG